ncbi:MFS transporter [Nitriliruptor alkaliphilus]|uniref:MFS transporter n=1 Tax=Nitriliruptor alkaliphilus TaxID=427918 RepID=UPI0006965589|nr:MFS transporter [Nitriliruptor alkaliphilus]
MATRSTTAPRTRHQAETGDGPAGSTLRGTGFGRLWSSTGAANLGDGVLLAGLPVLATTVTDSPAAIAGVTVALMLPMVLSALPAGALADRADGRRVLVAGNAVRAASLVGLLAIAVLVDVRLALVYLAAVVASSTEVLVDTTAQTAVPGLVPDDRLEGANARLMVTQVVGNQAVGAPIGAVLAAIGAAALLGPAAALYLVAAVAASRLRPTPRPRDTAGGTGDRGPVAQVASEVREGLSHLLADPVLGRLAAANALSNLGNTAFAAVFVVFVVVRLDLPASAYGVLLAAVAVGGLLGGALAERFLTRVGSRAAIRVGFGLAAACYAAVAFSRHAVVVGALACVLGAASMVINVAARTLRQRLVPDALLGRVTASMAAVSLVATPVGAVVGGVVAEWAGVAAAVGVAAVTNTIALVLMSRR